MTKHINIENTGNQLTGFTKEQKNIGISANIPPGFQKGTDKRHNPTVNKNGKAIRRKNIILFFIYIYFVVRRILKPSHATVLILVLFLHLYHQSFRPQSVLRAEYQKYYW